MILIVRCKDDHDADYKDDHNADLKDNHDADCIVATFSLPQA